MTTVGQLSSTLRRGVVCGWWLKCPNCEAGDPAWRADGKLHCVGCDWTGVSAGELVRIEQDDRAGRMP